MGRALPSIQRYTHSDGEYTGMVTTHTLAIYFLALCTHQNCLNGAALLSIQGYPHTNEDYTGSATDHTISICFIAIDTP